MTVVVPTHKQVKHGTEVTLSCKISDLEQEVTVQWIKDTDEVIEDGENFISSLSALDEGKQIATLTIKENAVVSDSTCTCRVHSTLYNNSPVSDTAVKLHVYGKSLV